ncbi:MAG: FAD-dependent oxidoreductase [Kiritimatiellae bacterium]|jgi:NADPH-dependent glutamate synthase beta subunit-like oxidoreductase/dihydroorotate dehydrogenase/Pyruvate/2-oxoacid:ferredoxin oxidoreductase delta subunit|nr:FAD-dependent oxidoreductase [Kiritimatiellia bacterium]
MTISAKRMLFNNPILTDAQLRAEIEKCEFCEEKPCKEACPCDCSPADFIMAVKLGTPADFQRAAAEIMSKNPLGGICGMVCPDTLCMGACVHKKMDCAVNIPAVQATIVAKARGYGAFPAFAKAKLNGRKVAVIGAGPAGLAAAVTLVQKGYKVDIFEQNEKGGGMCRLIPEHRLYKEMLEKDVAFCLEMGGGRIKLLAGKKITEPKALLKKGYQAVIVAAGLWEPIILNVPNKELAIGGIDFLKKPKSFGVRGKKVAVVGGGATALDCAVAAKLAGAKSVEMIALENVGEMPLTAREKQDLVEYGIDVNGRMRVTGILDKGGKVAGIRTQKVELPAGQAFTVGALKDVAGTEQTRGDIRAVVMAIGARGTIPVKPAKGVYYAGDIANGPTFVVTASGAGKNCAMAVDAELNRQKAPKVPDPKKSRVLVEGYNMVPVSLQTDFFGRKLINPFLLSASPASDGYEQMKKAYDAGWAGGIMKTAFDNLPIHIPAAYMTCFNDTTWGNCDNVSDHPIDRVCREVKRLIREYPDRLTGASTGGNVSGNDASDRKSWQSNTRKLEKAGAMVIEYSLSCPQGGEGAEGDIVSQNAALSAKIIGWVLEVGNPDVPKLFKLTSAVTDIKSILKAIKPVLEKHPKSKAGVTLANTFPSLAFKPGPKVWEDGVVSGISGEGITPVSYLCLASAGGMGVTISGNAGPMNYKAAADFLALGTNTVQFCTVVEKHGYAIIDELCSGLSHLMQARGIKSVSQLVGIAQPDPIRGFMDLDGTKQISDCDDDLCVQCGNCTRCPYLAISLNSEGYPETDPSKCIGCSLCVLQCPAKALRLRDRTPKEKQAMHA